MLRFIKLSSLTLLLTLVTIGALAQKVTFQLGTPGVVMVDEPFRIEFSLDAKPEGFTPPTFTGFNVIAGPTTSEGRSVSVVNGKVTQSFSYTITYVLVANNVGVHTIPAAQVRVDSKSYSSQAQQIEVVKDNSASPQDASSGQSGVSSVAPGGKIASDDILVKVMANRTTVYKGEPVRVTFKLYTRLPMSGIKNAKYPAMNGFWAQELNVDGYKWQRETLNGKVYDARVIKETLLYPQQSGTLHIEQFSLDVVAQIVTQNSRSNSLFDDFFGGGQSVQEINKTVSAPPIKITVNELPAGAPASFNGAVGKFKLNGGVDNKAITANSSGTYMMKILGSGNLPLIPAPKITLPASFEQYNMKTTESLNTTVQGISGYRQFEYPFIPRAEGTYTIDPVEFTYFDPTLVRYITLVIDQTKLDIQPDSLGGALVDRGMVSGLSKEDIKILDKDIRFINTSKASLESKGDLFFGSLIYYVILALIVILGVGAYLYLRKLLSIQQNVTLIRNKRANKVALQRLKAALCYMNKNSEQQFYEEMLRALWGYMSDKLNMPVANLTKDNIREALQKRGVAMESINDFIEIISNCEYAQYSPSSSSAMGEVYNSAARILSKFESVVK